MLDYNSVLNKATMENLIGGELDECLIIGINNKIYYSIHVDQIDKIYSDIPGIKKYSHIIQEQNYMSILRVWQIMK